MAEKKNGPWWALKNSGGKKDVALTLMIVAFVFSLGLAGLGAIESLTIGDNSVGFRPFDMGFATTVLVPLIGLYFGRRYTDTQRGLYDSQALWAKKAAEEKVEAASKKQLLQEQDLPEQPE